MRIFFVLLTGLTLLGACNKSTGVKKSKSYPDTLEGKWRYVEYFISSGGPGSWYTVNPVTDGIELKQNGEINSNLAPFKDASSYEVTDSVTIKFIIPFNPDGFLLYRYNVDTLQGGLILSPLKPLCIEGCASKFKR